MPGDDLIGRDESAVGKPNTLDIMARPSNFSYYPQGIDLLVKHDYQKFAFGWKERKFDFPIGSGFVLGIPSGRLSRKMLTDTDNEMCLLIVDPQVAEILNNRQKPYRDGHVAIALYGQEIMDIVRQGRKPQSLAKVSAMPDISQIVLAANESSFPNFSVDGQISRARVETYDKTYSQFTFNLEPLPSDKIVEISNAFTVDGKKPISERSYVKTFKWLIYSDLLRIGIPSMHVEKAPAAVLSLDYAEERTSVQLQVPKFGHYFSSGYHDECDISNPPYAMTRSRLEYAMTVFMDLYKVVTQKFKQLGKNTMQGLKERNDNAPR